MIGWTTWVTLALLGAFLIVSAICDVRTEKVPNRLTYPAIVIGILWSMIAAWIEGAGPVAGFTASMQGLGAGLLPFAVVFALGGFGGGDVKSMGALGALSASWQCVLAATFYAILIGAVMALVVMVRRGLVKRTASRLLGAALMATAKVKADLDTGSPRIPFSVAIAIGGAMAAIESLLGVQTPWAPFASGL